jgi:hypothetical protein
VRDSKDNPDPTLLGGWDVVEEKTTASMLGGANDDIKSNESQSNRHMPQPCACVTLSLALPSASSALRPPAIL